MSFGTNGIAARVVRLRVTVRAPGLASRRREKQLRRIETMAGPGIGGRIGDKSWRRRHQACRRFRPVLAVAEWPAPPTVGALGEDGLVFGRDNQGSRFQAGLKTIDAASAV